MPLRLPPSRFVPVAPLALAACALGFACPPPAWAQGPSAVPAVPSDAEQVRQAQAAAVPSVHVWRPGSNRPIAPRARVARRFEQVLLSQDDTAVLVRLTFAPSLRGAECRLQVSEGWSLATASGDADAAQVDGGAGVLRLNAPGRVAFLLRRTAETRSGELRVVVNETLSRLRLGVLPPAAFARLRQDGEPANAATAQD